MGCLFLVIPISLEFVSKAEYGIWLTVYSVLSWFVMFDFGLSNGLKNKITAAISTEDMAKAAGYISSAYFFLACVSMVLLILVAGLVLMGDVVFLFKTDIGMAAQLKKMLLVVSAIQLFRFSLEPLTTLLIACQRVGLAGWLNALGNLLGLATLYCWGKMGQPGIIGLAVSATLPPVIVMVLASYYFYNRELRKFRPSVKRIKSALVKEVLGISTGFFILQISALVIFSSDSFLILQLFSPADVVPYNSSYRYFSVLYIGFSLVTAPYWPAFTGSYISGEWSWIKKTVKRLIVIWGIFSVGAICFLIVSPYVYNIWLGTEVEIPLSLSISMAIFVILANWNNIFATFLNAASKIKMQVYCSVVIAFLNIPISIFFAKQLRLGPAGVMLATSCCLFLCSILQPLQVRFIINRKAKGIWNA